MRSFTLSGSSSDATGHAAKKWVSNSIENLADAAAPDVIEGGGGGVLNESGATLDIINTTISGNRSASGDSQDGPGAPLRKARCEFAKPVHWRLRVWRESRSHRPTPVPGRRHRVLPLRQLTAQVATSLV